MVHVSENMFMDEVSYDEGDVVEVDEDVLLVIRRSFDPLPYQVTTSAGVIWIDPEATGAELPIECEFTATPGAGFIVTGTGRLIPEAARALRGDSAITVRYDGVSLIEVEE